MKLLITGGNGQVAWEIIRFAVAQNYVVLAPPHQELDITNTQQVNTAIAQFKPQFVINTAAYTQVDKAETEIDRAYAVNRDGAGILACACKETQIPLLHLSTDYVFDGKQKKPYHENDPVAPLNVYGLSKWEGEEAVRKHCPQHIILRVSSVFGVHGHNFVKIILRLAKEKDSLRIVADQITCPTPAAAIAQTVLKIISAPQWGTYHYCGDEVVSWYDFARAIVHKEIMPITTAEYPTPARRPAYSVLDCHKLLTTFGIEQPSWRQELREVLDVLSTP
ncbi:MAG TPA: dTDP-4-dehydrorhamnose reductase [Hanamia sp.]|nr:dTDP-4-dehydrorhamnose reductase [Hanamia sp.]